MDTDGGYGLHQPPAFLPKQSESFVEAYRRLDEEICALESTTPGPRLMTAEAWVELLNSAKRGGIEQGVTVPPPQPPPPPLPNEVMLANGTVPNGGVFRRPITAEKDQQAESARAELVKVREVR